MKKELTYVLSLDASNLHKGVDDDFINKHYDATLPYNLDLEEMDTIEKGIIYTRKVRGKDKQFTEALINVKFKKTVKEENLNTDELRRCLYEDGFILNNEKYVLYKRSASKAKNGTILFIKEKYYNHMKKWSLLNVQFEEDEEVDLASLMAYESLSMSGLEGTINIPLDKIIIIDEEFSKFTTKASVTELENGIPITNDKNIEQENNLWDGQCLIDKSLLNKTKYESMGSVQLRNKLFKAMAFSTNIYDFCHNHNIKEVKDMFGRTRPIKDAKLVITRSCLKLFKFAYKFESDEAMFDSWLNNVSPTFGVCKSEHETKHGYTEDGVPINRLSYQMINSMPLSKVQVERLLQYEVDYINSLKNNLDVFMKHIELNDRSVAREMMQKLVSHNKNFIYTDVFKNFKRNTIRGYENKVRKGKVRLSHADYCIIVANPLEMLYKLIGKYDNVKQPLKKREVYTKLFADNEKLAVFRSPHICQANILHVTNKHCAEIDKYFNFTNNVIVINNIKSMITQTLQGSDEDGDSCLVTSNKDIVKVANKSKKMLIPLNDINFEITKRSYNNNGAYLIDKDIAKNKIGSICNLAQDVNTTIAHMRNEETLTKEKEKQLLDAASLLSSLSQLEIDKSKRMFNKEDLDIQAELLKIKNLGIIYGYFNKYTRDKKESKLTRTKCSMDLVQEVLDEKIVNANKSKPIKVNDLFNDSLYKTDKVNEKQIKMLKSKCEELDFKLKSINAEKGIDKKVKMARCVIAKDYAFTELEKLKFNESTIIAIVRRMYNEDNIMNGFKALILQALFTNKKGNLYTVMYKSPQKI